MTGIQLQVEVSIQRRQKLVKRLASIIQCSAIGTCVIACAAGCRHTIAVEPIEVKPIHLTLDINLKVDRELESFFDFEPALPSIEASPVSDAPIVQDATGIQGGQS